MGEAEPIRVTCGCCGAVLTARPDLIGQVRKCPNCKDPLRITPPRPPAPPVAVVESEADILRDQVAELQRQVAAMSRARHAPEGQRVQVIEATGKKWKRRQAIGALLAIAGVIVAVIVSGSQPSTGNPKLDALNNQGDGWFAFSTLAVFLGIGVFVYGRIGAWWEHG